MCSYKQTFMYRIELIEYILPCYLFTYSVIQNADAVLTSNDKIANANVESNLILFFFYLNDV